MHSRRVIVALARAVEILSAIRREDDKNGLWLEPKSRDFFRYFQDFRDLITAPRHNTAYT